MPDDDWALGQNEVDVRNEARKAAFATLLPFGAEQTDDEQQSDRDLADAIEHLRRLHETVPINPDAERRRQESITRTLDEIQRLMDG